MSRIACALLLIIVATGCGGQTSESTAAKEPVKATAVPAAKPAADSGVVRKIAAAHVGADLVESLLKTWQNPVQKPEEPAAPPPSENKPADGDKEQIDDKTIEELNSAFDQLSKTLETLNKPQEQPQHFQSDPDACEVTIPTGFYFMNYKQQDLNVDGETGSSTSLLTSSPAGNVCLFMALTFPVLKYFSFGEQQLLESGKNTLVSNFKFGDDTLQINEVLSTLPVSIGGGVGQEWRLRMSGNGQTYFALMQAHLKAPRVYTIVYVGNTEADINSAEARAFVSSLVIK